MCCYSTVVFTDQQAPNATVVTPLPLNIMDAAVPATADKLRANSAKHAADDANVSATASPQALTEVRLVSPIHQETMIDHEGPFVVTMQTSPARSIPDGLTAQVLLNGNTVATGTQLQLAFPVPERGTHQIQVRIVDSNNKLAAQSDIIDVHVKHQVSARASHKLK